MGIVDAAKYAAYQMKRHAGEIVKHPVKGTGKAIYGTLKESGKLVNKIAEPYADLAAAGMEKTAVGAYKSLTKKATPSLDNFYTGREFSAFGKIAVPVAGAAIGAGLYIKNTSLGPKPGVVIYGGEAPVMMADGVNSPCKCITLNHCFCWLYHV
jgi:hypothetical protein